MRNNIDKHFKQKLEKPQQPPADAWDFIQQRLPQPKEKKRVIPFWMKLSGIAVSLLLMTSLGYWLGTQDQTIWGNPHVVTSPESEHNNPPSTQNPNTSGEPSFEGEVPNYLTQEENVLNYPQNSSQFSSSGDVQNKVYSFNNSNYLNNYNNELSQNEYTEKQRVQLGIDRNPYLISWNNLELNPNFSFLMPNLTDAQLKKNSSKEFLLVSNEKSNNDQEKKKKKKIDFNRFHLSAFASPLAFNTFVGNSMLADEMSEYNTENSVTLAYGFKAAYSISPIFKVRTGVSVIGLEQITNGVPLSVDVSARPDNFSSTDNVNNIQYSGNVRVDNQSMVNSLAEMEISGRMGYGDVQQQTSYIEIPLEAELSLFQTNSIGISATGGGSTWLLSKNKIYVQMDDYTQELGEANNLNKVSFSANAGLKFDMNLTENIKLNIEPNFRYLINPVNNIEKYNPYTVGVNAGVSVSLK